jgi:hypothetical protein
MVPEVEPQRATKRTRTSAKAIKRASAEAGCPENPLKSAQSSGKLTEKPEQ